ncbi:hypothetical protein BC936DRAFT_139883 [Jimgerdemannia flammicorona]|uniref:Uncharacterized protein n=1 Tax=Jimgerdemannia flammicorona TaxID=994334 RepID=A0A433DHF0_9FUNG|nr:hypothetical protein BC936DRAFT_139883 [Jimgerdemannia flammicorona]
MVKQHRDRERNIPCLKDIRPDVIQQMQQRVLTSQPHNSQRRMLNDSTCSLPVHKIPIHKRVFEQRRDGIDIILAHLTDILEDERHRLEHAVLYVELWHAVLVHEGRQDGEGGAGLGYDGDGNGCAHAVLALLYLEVVE